MKKKKLSGKLSLEKSRISALDGSKIKGGCITIFCLPSSIENVCATNDCDPGTEGSGCRCL